MKILFICTHNRCRSILGEAITNHYGNGRITAVSAGSSPVGEVHPLTIKYLTEHGISTDSLQSQSWDDIEQDDLDVVITVCDNAANEQCPIWFGNTLKVHWGFSDPSKVQGSEEDIAQAFHHLINIIKQRVAQLIDLSEQTLSHDELHHALVRLHTNDEY